ncbi:MAG: hypothetical protein ACT4P5_16695 [Armatimonadota bacterium]
MPRAREELRRGVRSLIEVTSREMDALAGATSVPVPAEAPAEDESRPILRLVREPAVRPAPAPAPPTGRPAPATPSGPVAPPIPGVPADVSAVHPRKGVCAAYYVNHACWEVADAYCNQALHVCMLRDCPVYHLNRDELERTFAAKFAHLW